MVITIDRAFKKKDYTISHLLVDGALFCNAIEDADRGLTSSMSPLEIQRVKAKHPGKTAIPRGKYKLTITYSPKFRKDLILVNDVPGYSGIRIHPGNTAEDSLGCILPGKNDKVGMVSNSRIWCQLIQNMVMRELKQGHTCWLEVL